MPRGPCVVGVGRDPERLEKAHGITFDSIEPLNEPNTPYWSTPLGPDGLPLKGTNPSNGKPRASTARISGKVVASRAPSWGRRASCTGCE